MAIPLSDVCLSVTLPVRSVSLSGAVVAGVGRHKLKYRSYLVTLVGPGRGSVFPSFFLPIPPRRANASLTDLVDHMLVSKIKPCKCQHMPPNG